MVDFAAKVLVGAPCKEGFCGFLRSFSFQSFAKSPFAVRMGWRDARPHENVSGVFRLVHCKDGPNLRSLLEY